jgi:hypothetical protein
MTDRLTPVLVTTLLASCTAGSPSTVRDDPPEEILARLKTTGRAMNAPMGGGAVRYLGFEAWPEGALPGDAVTVVHWWYAERKLDRSYRVFVHGLVAGARGWMPHGDHDPVPPADEWPPGKVIRDEHRLDLPARIPGDAVELRVGLYAGDYRLPVDQPHQHDGANAIRAGRIPVGGTPVPLPTYSAPKLAKPLLLDGVLTDAEWGGAPWIDGFMLADASGPSALRTRARLAWDATHLYLGFSADDPDLLGGMTERDQPIYREEALEIFVDPDGDGLGYEELQVSPRNVQFDASFSGGARRNMRTEWNARYSSAVKLDGTVEPPSNAPASDADRGWSAELAIEIASLPDAKPPEPGARWKMNLFRIAKDRVAGEMQRDESAWSPPLQGDFHNLDRFGELVLSP